MLIDRVKKGQIQEVSRLLNLGVNVNTHDENKLSPLHHAALSDDADIAKLLLDAGALKEEKDNANRTPLWYAAARGSIQVMTLLIGSGVEVNASDNEGHTPLWCAATRLSQYGQEIIIAKNMVRMLLDNGANPNIVAVYKEPYKNDLFYFVLSHGGTALDIAVRNGFLDMVELLLDHGANPNIKMQGRSSYPLLSVCYSIAFHHGSHYSDNSYGLDVIKLLLAHGADINIIDKDNGSYGLYRGYTLLENALRGRCTLEFMDWLISKGADVTLMNSGLSHGTIESLLTIDTDILEKLITLGFNINLQDEVDGSTLLHFAVRYSIMDRIQFLIQHKANPNILDRDGHTPLFFARNEEVKAHLLACGAVENSSKQNGK
jgi:ankyrin repeat protein